MVALSLLVSCVQVGYGDIAPVTPAGRMVLSLLILIMLIQVPIQINLLVKFLDKSEAGQGRDVGGLDRVCVRVCVHLFRFHCVLLAEESLGTVLNEVRQVKGLLAAAGRTGGDVCVRELAAALLQREPKKVLAIGSALGYWPPPDRSPMDHAVAVALLLLNRPGPPVSTTTSPPPPLPHVPL